MIFKRFFCWIFVDFEDFFWILGFFEIFLFFLDVLRFFGLFSKILRLLLNVKNVNTEHLKWPNISINSMKSSLFA